MKGYFNFMALLLWVFSMISCKKDAELIDGNTPPTTTSVPTVLIENYVNRIFIDLIGRAPLQTEMDSTVAFFKAHNLSMESRKDLIEKLQTDTTWIEGDTSYNHAYYHRFYEMVKARMLEGEGDDELRRLIGLSERVLYVDSLSGDTIPQGNAISSANAQLTIEKLENVLKIETQYKNGEIEIDEVYRRLANNSLYDMINMNTFNFINATFDNMFYRFPINAEFYSAWDMIEDNKSSSLFGKSGQNKGDYLQIITTSKEFYEGIIMWSYLSLLARFPTTTEVNELMAWFYTDPNFQKIQQEIMITDEYANF